jgi:hypothetical protein
MTTGKPRDEKLKAELIAKFQQFAAREGGVPGIRAFVEETGAQKHLWDGSLWPSWRAFLEDAGFKSNELTQAIPDEKILGPLAQLTRRFQRFPTVR